MKTLVYNLMIILAMSISLPSYANTEPVTGKHQEKKTITETFDVNADALVSLKSKFGDMEIRTWDENKVVIVVEIEVEGSNERKVKDALERIEIDIEGSRSLVSAKTKFNNPNRGWGNNLSYSVNYTVKMPKSNSLDASNDYGSFILNELDGSSQINCDYGKVIIGKVNHQDNDINMDYTNNSSIDYIKSANINADYSDLSVERAEDIDLNADYSNIKFEQVKTLNFNVDYGKVIVGKAGRMIGNSDYTNVKIAYLISGIDLNMDYGGLKIEKLDANFDRLEASVSYTNIKVGIEEESSFDFDISLSYGDFDYGDGYQIQQKIKDGSKRKYIGTKGSNAKGKVYIKTSYGDVDFD